MREPFTNRTLTPELMDAPDVSRGDLERAFRFIRAVNRRLGGARALKQVLESADVMWPSGRPLRLLDVGTGCADIPLDVVRWAEGRRRDLHVVAADNHATTLEIARDAARDEPRVEVVDADARHLTDDHAAGSFDVAHAGMFLHHLPDLEIMTVLRIMQRLARVVVWNDLTRDALSHVGIRVLTLGTAPIVRHDAVVSVAKGFTRREALELARRTGLENLRYRRHLFGRFTLTAVGE